MNYRRLSLVVAGLAPILLVIAACGTPEPIPAAIQVTSTSAPIPATPTQAPAPTERVVAEPSPGASVLSKATRHALFIQTWMSINDRYVDPDYGGLDWETVRDEYAAKVANATSDQEFYALMREMIDRLGDQHSTFLSPDQVARLDALYQDLKVSGGIGAYLNEVDGELVLVQVWQDHPASEAGLRPGERIVAVDGVPWEQFSSVDEAILAITGEVGTEAVLTVRGLDGTERGVTLMRAVVDPNETLVQGRTIEGTHIGLVTIGDFGTPDIVDRVRETLGGLVDNGPLDALIVDVRANPGGDPDVMLDTLALFLPGGSIGRLAGRDDASDLLIPEGHTAPEVEGLPVAVLIGPYTSGVSECFAAGMQLYGRATIVGLPSEGDTETAFYEDLSDGSVLTIAEQIYQLPDGTVIEGRGVQPDVPVDMDWQSYNAGDDPQIQAAIEVLGSK
jgi:carboxyl-terminal processing protease